MTKTQKVIEEIIKSFDRRIAMIEKDKAIHIQDRNYSAASICDVTISGIYIARALAREEQHR